MACGRGAASPSTATRYRLFADSAGRCQNPECLQSLFVHLEIAGTVHFGEIAHVIAASGAGPRGDITQTPAALGSWDNLVLLCANCHTMIDRAESDFPVAVLQEWKASHLDKVDAALGLRAFRNRQEARQSILPYLVENRSIFETRGPHNEYRFDPESELATSWRNDVARFIIPNNRSLLRIMDANRLLLRGNEPALVERFRMHVRDLEGYHVLQMLGTVRSTYPPEVDGIFCEDDLDVVV